MSLKRMGGNQEGLQSITAQEKRPKPEASVLGDFKLCRKGLQWLTCEPRNTILRRRFLSLFITTAVTHHVSIFRRVVVIIPQH